jgi:hypothetical protein
MILRLVLLTRIGMYNSRYLEVDIGAQQGNVIGQSVPSVGYGALPHRAAPPTICRLGSDVLLVGFFSMRANALSKEIS